MSRVSSLVFGSMVVAIVSSVAGCRVSAETKTRFTETNVLLTDKQDWAGEKIIIDIATPGAISQGGLNVETKDVTLITANARILATAFKEDSADAQLSINDVKARFQITHTDASTITISCPHGDTHGGSSAGESGCELTNIIIPQGNDNQKLSVEIKTGNGDVTINAGSAKLIRLAGNSQNGDIRATVGPSSGSVGADIALVALKGDDVTLTVPQDFAADSVNLVADPGKASNAFPDITALDGTVGRGAVGAGFKTIKLTSVNFAGSTGTVTLK